jgi:hypothetical protein
MVALLIEIGPMSHHLSIHLGWLSAHDFEFYSPLSVPSKGRMGTVWKLFLNFSLTRVLCQTRARRRYL